MAGGILIVEEPFGTLPKSKDKKVAEEVRKFTLSNASGMQVQIMNYGATIISLHVPDKDGLLRDVVLGFDDILGYWSPENSYFGGGIGRVANRTGNATFTLNGQVYNVTPNDGGKHHLHGGLRGFDKRVWDYEVGENKVIFSYNNPDGEEGYPGDVLAQISYELTADNRILVLYAATTNQPTPINMTNHTYFNLSGHDTADQELQDHVISINAEQYTPVDEELIPTGELVDVEGTIYDFRTPKNLPDLLNGFPGRKDGYDHNFCINQAEGEVMNLAVSVTNESSKIRLEVYSDQPGLQFYSGNFLPDAVNGEEAVIGKGGAKYTLHGAMCLETQNYPNAINLPQFPNSVLNPGELYTHNAVFKFTVAE